jgi:hypothetical protein
MWLFGAFHAILKFAITLWQFSGDDACPSGNVPAPGGSKKYSLTDLKLIKRHDTLSPNHNIIYEIPGYAPAMNSACLSAGLYRAGSTLKLWTLETTARLAGGACS